MMIENRNQIEDQIHQSNNTKYPNLCLVNTLTRYEQTDRGEIKSNTIFQKINETKRNKRERRRDVGKPWKLGDVPYGGRIGEREREENG